MVTKTHRRLILPSYSSNPQPESKIKLKPNKNEGGRNRKAINGDRNGGKCLGRTKKKMERERRERENKKEKKEQRVCSRRRGIRREIRRVGEVGCHL